MNQLYILLLALWSAFNASDAWYPDNYTTTVSPDAWHSSNTISVTDSPGAWHNNTSKTTSVTDSLYAWIHTTTSMPDSDTSSFLIYNKDHDKCVYAVSATVVQAVPCDVSSNSQRFRWISSSQIISLSFNLCLGSEEVKDWAKIILLPCKDHSSVQTWECKDETLFGLKGHSLHLNYGHHANDMMLYTGSGVWSHWLIYGTPKKLCSRRCQVLDHHEEGISVFYICFSSFVAVGLLIMTAAVIMTTIRSKAKGNKGRAMTFRSKDFENA